MSLSLEIKRFKNSDSIGKYVSVILPDGRSSGSREAREALRNESAERGARNSADNSARAAAKARERVDNLSRLRKTKQAELEAAENDLKDIISQQKNIKPVLDSRRSEYEKALKIYEDKKNIYEVKRESFEALEKAYFEAAEAEKAANLVLSDCRANASEAGAESPRSPDNDEAAKLKLLAGRSRVEAMNAARIESEKSIKYNELKGTTDHLSSVLISSKKRLAELKTELEASNGEYERASAAYSSAKEALADAEKELDGANIKSDSLKAKVNSKLSRLASAASELDRADSNRSDLAAKLIEAETAVKKAETEFAQSDEMLKDVKLELDAARAQAKRALDVAAESEERYSNVVSSADEMIIYSKKNLLNAETEYERRQSESLASHEKMERDRAVMEKKYADMMSAKEVLDFKKASFDEVDSVFQDSESDRIYQDGVCEALSNELNMIEKQLDDAFSTRDSAVSDAESSARELRQHTARSRSSRYETVKIHYLQIGVGEDLLLIHSVGQSLYTFRELISRLSSRFRVTALDLVGFGYSQKPAYFDYSLDEMGELIGNFMDSMGMEYAHLFGFSMGAGYAINFARRFPDRVGRLVLLSPGGITPEMPLSVRALSNRLFCGVASALISYKSVKNMLSECFFDLTNYSEEICQEYYRPVAIADTKRAIKSSIINYDDEAVIHSLRRVGAETLLLWGSEDRWHPLEMSEMFRTLMPRITYLPVRNAGHLAHEEKAERVAQMIKQFIPCGYDEEEEETAFR